MSAFFTDEQIAYLSGRRVQTALVGKFDFKSGAVYAWNGNYKLTIGGNIYQPMYGMASIEGLSQSSDGSSSNFTVTVSGLPEQAGTDFLAAALADTDEVNQRIITLSLVLFDEDWQPVGSPLPLRYGFMQPPKVSRTPATESDGAVQTIVIEAEDIFFNRARPAYGRNNDADQQARSPGDKFFGFVASLVNKTVKYPDY